MALFQLLVKTFAVRIVTELLHVITDRKTLLIYHFNVYIGC